MDELLSTIFNESRGLVNKKRRVAAILTACLRNFTS